MITRERSQRALASTKVYLIPSESFPDIAMPMVFSQEEWPMTTSTLNGSFALVYLDEIMTPLNTRKESPLGIQTVSTTPEDQ